MNKEKKIIKFVNKKENTDIISKEIIKIFEDEANKENVEYSFDISNGEIKKKDASANTYFVFDTKKDTKIDEFKKCLFDEDLEDIKEGSEEEKELLCLVRNFLLEVCEKINNNYHEVLDSIIRTIVLGGKADRDTIPLNTIELIMIDVSDYSSIREESKYLLHIFKENKEHIGEINTDEIVSFVQDKKEETDMEYSEILKFEKDIGNPLFKDISEIKRGRKFLSDITIYMYIDYSLRGKEE